MLNHSICSYFKNCQNIYKYIHVVNTINSIKSVTKGGDRDMLLWILVILIIVGLTVIGTVMVGKTEQEDYGTSTKGNITRLSIIYLCLGVILVVGVASYIYFYG